MYIRALGLAIVLGLASCRQTSHTKDADKNPEPLARVGLRGEVLGCYALLDRNGRSARGQFYHAPAIVRLDSANVAASPTHSSRQLVPDNGINGAPHDAPNTRAFGPSWASDSLSDSLRLDFGNGFSGAVFVLAAPPGILDTLRGRVEERWDVGPSADHRGSAVAVRVPCTATMGGSIAPAS